MTERIKLTEYIVRVSLLVKDEGGFVEIKVGTSHEKVRQLKQQILDDQDTLEYTKQRMEESRKLMYESVDQLKENGVIIQKILDTQLYEYHKGQFLAFRQVVDPHYR